MKKKLLLALTMVMCLSMPLTANASVRDTSKEEVTTVEMHADSQATEEGWKLEDGKWRYYQKMEDGSLAPLASPVVMDENDKLLYATDKDGYMKTGLAYIDMPEKSDYKDGYYYFAPATDSDKDPTIEGSKVGLLVTDEWINDEAGDVYLGSTGLMAIDEWVTKDGKDVYVDADGHVSVSQWIEKDSKPVYVDENGNIVVSQWIQDKDQKPVYVDANGNIVTSKWVRDADKKLVFLDADGYIADPATKKGQQVITDKEVVDAADAGTYFFNEDGTYTLSNWAKDQYYGTDGKLVVSAWVKNPEGVMVWVNASGVVEAKDGLQEIGDGLYYFDKGSYLKNTWVKVDGKWYYAGADGKMLKGLQTVYKQYFYFNEKGVMLTAGWNKTTDGDWYVMNKDGSIKTNQWLQYEGAWYYLLEDGKMAVNWWVYSGGKWYWLKDDGKMAANQWILNGKTWYFVESSGIMKTGWLQIGRTWYFLKSNGAMAEGWTNVWGATYYLTPGSGDMKTGWLHLNGTWYYMNSSGARMTGWVNVWGARYYLDNNGAMAEGWKSVGGKWYYLLPGNGAMRTGWLFEGGSWYYLESNGVMATGWEKVSGKWYYLNSNGKMAQGWKYLGGTWYYLLPGNGAMQTGWLWDGSAWYYLRSNGAMVANSLEKIDGKLYYLNASGAWSKLNEGWYNLDGYKMYVNASGTILQDVTSKLSTAQKRAGYYITVNRRTCVVTIYAKDMSTGKYTVPVKALRCSVGLAGTPTPTGTYSIGRQERWHELMGPSWGQYCSHVVNGIWFHSVAGSNTTSYNLSAGAYNMLGSPASHGCIRLNVRDAKWIYDNCSSGTRVSISDSCAQPLEKPAGIKIPASQNWDPTDPKV